MTSPSTQGLGAEVLAQLPIAAISQTIGGEIVAVNDEAVRILGIEAAELIGRTPEAGGWLPVHEDGTPFTPEDRPDRVAVRTGRAVRNVLMGTSDGHGPRRWFRVSSEPRLATNGAPVSVLTLLAEVTDGQRRLRELVELISLSDDMMTRHDLTGRCVWASPATRELIGSGPRYVVGSPGLPTAAADDDERLLADVESTVDAGEDDLPHRTWRATRIDGSVRWVETHGRLQRAEDGSPTGFALFHRDVTERRRAELEAIEAERRFRVGFEHAPIAMKLMSPSGRIIAANQAFATLTGHAQDDIVGRSWQEFVHPDDIEASFRIIAAIVSGQHGTSVRRRRYHRPDGSVADTIHHVTGVRDDDGQVVQVFSQIVDITETSRAEQRLRASEARLAAVLAAAPDGIVVMDEHGTIETFSQSAAEIFGLNSAEAVGVGIEMLLPTDWFDGNMGEVGRFLGSDDLGDGGRQRVTAQRADGSTFPLELSIAEAGVDGDHCFIGICRDVTDEEIALRRLSESEQRFRSLADAAPVGIFTTDADGLCTYTNPRWQEICGLTATEALGPGWSTALHPEDAAAILESWTATATDGRPFSESFRLLVEEQERWVHADASPSIVDGEAVAYVGVVDDITAERRANEAIAGAEERFRAAFEQAPIGIAKMRADGVLTSMNAAFVELLGLDGPLPTRLVDHAAESEVDLISTQLDGVLSGREDSCSFEHGVTTPDGVHRWLLTQATALLHATDDDACAIVQAVDMTERRALERRLRHQADHDPLTGLANRRAFATAIDAHLARVHRRGASGAVAIIDLDHFKTVNDTLGHAAGDELLQAVADELRTQLRSDDVVARFGGDEFAILMPTGRQPQAEALGERITASIERRAAQLVDTDIATVTASVGIVVIEEEHTDGDTLLALADTSLYEAKRSGRNRFELARTVG